MSLSLRVSCCCLSFSFAVGPPRLYVVPLSFSGHSEIAPFKELAGPPIASGATNPGSSAHWRVRNLHSVDGWMDE